MAAIDDPTMGGKTGAAWSVFVVFDDPPARKRATAVCDSITARFWPDLEFDLHWCDIHRLESQECVQTAVDCAESARIVIFATSARTGLSPGAMNWLANWSRKRHGREGVLIALIEASAEGELRDKTDMLLRNTAHQAGLDYLTDVPACGLAEMSDEPDWINAKAQEMGPVLGSILTTPIPPPHPG